MFENVDRYQNLIDTGNNFLEDRPIMREHNYASLAALLRLLAGEVEEAIETVERGDAEFEQPKKAIEQELADIGIFLVNAFQILGSDMYAAMMEKFARNMVKYPAFLFKEGDYNEKAMEAKGLWIASGGKDEFYNGDAKQFIRFDERAING